jgi:uncharacterized membrane protein YagU involved in acid resistance
MQSDTTTCCARNNRRAHPLIDRLKIWLGSKTWFWELRAELGKIRFVFERSAYNRNNSATKAKINARIFGSFTWIGVKSLFWVVLGLAALISAEDYLRDNQSWLAPLSAVEKEFNIDQLRLYAQLLTAIFSIYFATIGIILSAGYTRLRRDIIRMLTNEQVGSVYSRVLVLAAMFCLAATTLPSFGFEPGLFVHIVGAVLTVLSALALFPLGQRLFNFFDLNVLVHSEILPNIVRHIEGAANRKNSISLANHHSKAGKQLADDVRPEVPWHQRLELGDWPAFSDAGQGLGEPGEWIDVVHLGRLEKRRQRRPCTSTALTAGE